MENRAYSDHVSSGEKNATNVTLHSTYNINTYKECATTTISDARMAKTVHISNLATM